MTFNTARNTLAIMFYGTEEGKKINTILNQVDENPWHTGTPTEEGTYLVTDGFSDFAITYFDGEKFSTVYFPNHAKVIAWQRIEPYKEASGKASFDCSAPNCLDCERNDECNHIGLF